MTLHEKDKLITTELGIERLCVLCCEYWPLDPEFFYKRGNGFHSYCKSCVTQRCHELRHGAVRKCKLYKRKRLMVAYEEN